MTFIPAMLSRVADAWASLALIAGTAKGAERRRSRRFKFMIPFSDRRAIGLAEQEQRKLGWPAPESSPFDALIGGGGFDRRVGFDRGVGERTELAFINKGAQHGVDDPRAEERGDLSDVVLRRDLDHLHADQSLAGDDAQHAEDLTRCESTRLRGPGAGGVARIDGVDIKGEKDRLGAS